MTARVATVVFALFVGAAGATAAPVYRSATPPQARKLMIRYLDSKYLHYRWVACLYTGRSFHGARIVRCNVDFGDPHIEAYCIVLRNGRLYTDHQDHAIPCRRDDRAPPATIVSS